MSGEYDSYNQAVRSDPQLREIEKEAQEQFNTEMFKLSSARNQLNSANKNINKQLRTAAITNQQYDRREVASAREQIEAQRGMLAGQEQQLKESLKPIEQERAKIERAKNKVKSPEILKAQGYKKEVRGNQVIYYKEDTYNRKKGDKRTFREEEYIFTSEGQPVKIIKRDDARRENRDQRFIYDEEVVEFKNGLVTRFEEREEVDGDDEYEYREFYDEKGRLDEQRYYRDGKFTKEKEYKYNDKTGQVTIETETAAAKASRKAAREAEAKFWDQWNKAYWEAKDQGINISVSGDRFKTLESKAKEFNRQYKKGIDAKNSVYEVKISTKNNPKSDVQKTQYKNKFGDVIKTETQTTNYFTADEIAMQASLSPAYYENKKLIQNVLNSGSKSQNKDLSKQLGQINIKPVNFVNQGTDTENIPKIDLNLGNQNSQRVITKTDLVNAYNKKQFEKEYNEAGRLKKFFMTDWEGVSDFQAQKGNYGKAFLTGITAGVQDIGVFLRNPIQNTKTAVTTIVTQPDAVLQGIADKAKRNPAGFAGSLVPDLLLDKGIGSAVSKTKNVLRPAQVIESPANIRTSLIDDTIKTESFGNFQIESGLIKRTRKDFSFESIGNLERVRSFDFTDAPVPDQLRLAQSDMPKLLRDSPESIKFIQTSTELSPFVRSPGSKTRLSNLADDAISREVFRGEIETKIRDARGNILRTEKQPAELIRKGGEQTLFIDGKPFNIKSEIIDTPKGIGILEFDKKVTAFREEGAFGLDPKRQTIKSTTTDAAGNQKISFTQKELAPEGGLYPGKADLNKQFKQISADQKKLLSNAPFNDVFDSSSRALTNPMLRANKKGARMPKSSGLTNDAQIFSGVSFNAEKEALSVVKSEKNIIDAVITGEKDLPKSLGYEQPKLTSKKTDVLESPAVSEERLFREVFGNDFVNNAKLRKTIDLGPNPFDDFKPQAPSFDQTIAFKAQETRFKSTNDLFKQTPSSPKTRGSSQQNIFMDASQTSKTRTAKPKEINVKDIGLNPAMGVDFAKVNMPKSPKGFGFLGAAAFGNSIPGMAQQPKTSGSNQGFMPGVDMGQDGAFISKQISGQGFKPAVDLGFVPGMAQGKMMETAQRTTQDLTYNFPTMPPVNIPGFPTTPPGGGRKPPKAGSSKPAQMQSSPRKKPTLNGEYMGSLTGALLGKTTKKDLKNMTGLEVRPIKIRGKK